MSDPQPKTPEERLDHLAYQVDCELEDAILSHDGYRFRKALDAYVDARVSWILSQAVIDGARIVKVGECPST